jgi:hypothetical protein
VSVTVDGGPTNASNFAPSVSEDGRYVAFASDATTIVAGDTNGQTDVFVRDMQFQTNRLVSLSTTMGGADFASYDPSISADGRYVAFMSDATNLIPGDSNWESDVFVRDLAAGFTERVSSAVGGGSANGYSGYDTPPRISGSGRYVVFDSVATNLVSDDTNGFSDIFLADRGVLARTLLRSPLASSKTYKHKHKWARFTLSARLADSNGVGFAGVIVYLQHSKNGKTKWHNHYALVTDAAGVASRAFKTKKQSTTYYRWKATATGDYPEIVTAKQRIRVK